MVKKKNQTRAKIIKPLLSWEIKIKSQNGAWYFAFWFLGMVLFASIFILIFKNWLGALAVIILTTTYLAFTRKLSQVKKISLFKIGLKFDEQMYLFEDILFFKPLVFKDKEFLLLFTNARLMPEISFELPQGRQKEKILNFFLEKIPLMKKNVIPSSWHLESYLGV